MNKSKQLFVMCRPPLFSVVEKATFKGYGLVRLNQYATNMMVRGIRDNFKGFGKIWYSQSGSMSQQLFSLLKGFLALISPDAIGIFLCEIR